MRRAISELVATLIVGAGFDPKAELRPVVKHTRLQPPAIWPVTEAGSKPGLSMNRKPLSMICSPY